MYVDRKTRNGVRMNEMPVVRFSAAENTSANGGVRGDGVERYITYKRRKFSKNRPAEACPLADETISESGGTTLSHQTHDDAYDNCSIILNDANDYRHAHWVNVLERILESPESSEGGIKSCIRYALAHNEGCIHGNNRHRPRCQLPMESQNFVSSWNASREHKGVTLDESKKLEKTRTFVPSITELCRGAFLDIITSEKFVSLCSFLCENFQGIKADNFFGFSLINSRMENGEYEHSFDLFASDVLEMWKNCKKIGDELANLANSLSKVSQASFQKQDTSVDGGAQKDLLDLVPTKLLSSHELNSLSRPEVFQSRGFNKFRNCYQRGFKANPTRSVICDGREAMYRIASIEPVIAENGTRNVSYLFQKHEESSVVGGAEKDSLDLIPAKQFSSYKLNYPYKAKECEPCSLNKIRSCHQCGTEANATHSLICDGCEAVYHLGCIDPFIAEIPTRSWYCRACSVGGKDSPKPNSTQNNLLGDPQVNCVVCERLKDATVQTYESEGNLALTTRAVSADSAESSDYSTEKINWRRELATKRGIPRLCKKCKTGEEEGMKFLVCQHSQCPYKYYHMRCLRSMEIPKHGPLWYCPSCLCRGCLIDKDDNNIVLCDGCDEAYHIYCMVPPHTSVPKGEWYCIFCNIVIKMKQNNMRKAVKSVPAGSMDLLLSAAKKLHAVED